MEAARDVHVGGKLDHGRVVTHLPGTESLAEIAIKIDRSHVVSPCRAGASADGELCHVAASTALTAAPATLASPSASMLR